MPELAIASREADNTAAEAVQQHHAAVPEAGADCGGHACSCGDVDD